MEPTPGSTAAKGEGEGGSAAFRRLLLEQHAAHQHLAAAAPGGAAEWAALVQQHAAALGMLPHPAAAFLPGWAPAPMHPAGLHPLYAHLGALQHLMCGQPVAHPPLFAAE